MKLIASLSFVAGVAALVACSATSPKTTIADDSNPTDPASSSTGGLPTGSSSGKTASSSSSTSSTSSSSGSSGKGTSTSSSSGSTSSSGSSGTSTSSSSGGGGDATCTAKADYDTCSGCCETNHSTGADTFYGALIDCLCGSSVCATQCATSLCAASPTNPPSGSACETCIQNKEQTSCQTPVSNACGADPDCVALDTCYGACDTAFPE